MKPTKAIVVNVKDLKIDPTAVKVEVEKKKLKIAGQQPDKDNQLYVITLEQELPKDTVAVVFIPFSGVVEATLSGLYRSSYFNPETKKMRYLCFLRYYEIIASSTMLIFSKNPVF